MKRKLTKRNKNLLSHRLKTRDRGWGGFTLVWQPFYQIKLGRGRFKITETSWCWFPKQSELKDALDKLQTSECLFI